MQAWVQQTAGTLPAPANPFLAHLARRQPLAEELENYWLDPDHQSATTWRDHLDINAVMLVTSLLPAGFYGEP